MSQLATSVEFIELHMEGALSGGNETTASGMLTKGQDISNCVPFISWYCGNDSFNGNFPDIWFTDEGGPAINTERSDHNDYDMYIKGYVVEFDPTKVKVYQGNIPTTINYNAETPVTITTSGTFTQNRTAMKFYYRASGGSNDNYLNRFLVKGRVNSDGTTISFKKMINYANTHYGHYYAFESIDEDFTVHHQDSTLAGGISYETGVYDWHNTFLIHSYCGEYDGYGLSYISLRAYLWGNSRVAVNKESSSYTSHYNVQKIEFNNDATTSGVRYCPKITSYHTMGSTTTIRDLDFRGNVQATDSLTMVVTQNPSRMNNTSDSNKGGAFNAVWLTSSGTEYRIERAESGYDARPTYYLVDWNGQEPLYPDTGSNPSPISSGISPVKSVENISANIYEHVEVVQLSKGQDVNNCIVFKSGFATKTSSYDQVYQHETLTYFRGNELYLERGNEGWDCPVELSVVEFYPEQIKVQQGEFVIGMNSTSTTVTIEEVDTSKTFLVFGHFYGGGEDYWGYHQCRGSISNSTTLTFDRGTSHTYPIMGAWYLAEDLSDNWEVNHGNTGFSTFSAYSYEWPSHASVYNTFVLISSKIDTTSTGPSYATWQVYYHGPIDPARLDRYSNSYNSQLNFQVVRFSDNSRIKVQYKWFDLTGTQTEESFIPYTSMSGLSITPILSNLNGQYRVNYTGNTQNVLAFTKVAYDPDIHQITVSRNNNGNYSTTSAGTIFIVCWEGAENDTGSKEIDSQGYFIKSVEHLTYVGSSRRKSWWLENGQDLNNCLPIPNYNWGEDDGDDPDRQFYVPYLYPELGIVQFESYWGGNPGIDLDMPIIEFDPEQVKIQRGFSYIWDGATTTTATIEEVDINKTFMMHYVLVSDNVGSYFGGASIAGKINTSTQLHFERGVTNGNTMISWFVVECLQDQWSVQHGEINNNNSTYYTWNCDDVPEHTTISWMNYSQEQNYVYPSYCYFRTYPDHDQRGIYQIRANRQATSAEVERMNFSAITFNDDLGIYVDHVHFYFGTSDNSVTVNLGREYDMNRTIFWPGQAQPMMRTNTTSYSAGPQRGYVKCEFQDSSTLRAVRATDSYAVEAWGHVYLIELPLPSHKVSGVVREKGDFVSRKLHLHRTDTGELLSETTSSGIDGTYNFLTTYSGSTYVVCFDDEAGTVYNGLIETDVYPTTITGSWPADQGWV